MTSNKVVIRYRDGRILKGTTMDFSPVKQKFHLHPFDKLKENIVHEVELHRLKAIFFVKDFVGDKSSHEQIDTVYSIKPPAGTKKLLVEFVDGEKLVGAVYSYSTDKPGFYLIPLDTHSNNLRIFVVFSSVKTIKELKNE